MSRIVTFAALAALLALPAVAATPCNLTMSMSCANGTCTALTTNSGGTTCTPTASVPAVTQSGSTYFVFWSTVSDSNATFTVEESTAPDFSANLVSQNNVTGFSAQFSHMVGTTTRYYYRVRANICSGSPGPISATVSIVVQALAPQTGRSVEGIAPAGSTAPTSYQVHIDAPPGSGKQALDVPFTVSVDKPYLSVSPASGTLPPGGTNVTITANPTNLPTGANTGTLTVQSNGSTISTKSVAISLVTPVGPGTKTIPPSNALIIPVVAHLQGARGPFQSDVRLTNTSSASVQYQVTYT